MQKNDGSFASLGNSRWGLLSAATAALKNRATEANARQALRNTAGSSTATSIRYQDEFTQCHKSSFASNDNNLIVTTLPKLSMNRLTTPGELRTIAKNWLSICVQGSLRASTQCLKSLSTFGNQVFIFTISSEQPAIPLVHDIGPLR